MVGRKAATRIIGGVEWRFHCSLLSDCANQFNKMHSGEQKEVIDRAIQRRRQVPADQQAQFTWKEVIQVAAS
ncbi:MAG TPA: hypothetical protein PLW99_02405 [Candidatus Paceibacterota bacterium]|nr:hypothetical protein [Candidatus Paceibacterota bacterium]